MDDNSSDLKKKDMLLINKASHIFGVSISAGIAAIILGAYIDSRLITLLIPLGVMVYYINTVRNDNLSEISVEQKADSVYYMGFIFTLVAMTASLVALANSGEDLEFRPVVTNFGLALATTILGLIVRIAWLQLSAQSLDDAESILKERIIRRTQELQEQTERIVASMTALSSQMTSVTEPLKKNFENLAKSFDISEKINQNLEELNTSVELISGTFQSFSNRLDTINPSIERLDTNNNKIALSIDHVNRAISSLETSVTSTSKILENNTNSMADSLTQYQQILLDAQQSLILNTKELIETNRQAQQKLLDSNQDIADSNKETQESLKITAEKIIEAKKELSEDNQ